MRKTLLTLFTFVACMATAWAEDVVFDFTNPTGLTPSVTPDEEASKTGVEFEDVTFTNGEVSIALNKGGATTPIRIWTTTKLTTELRTYKNSSFTISASQNITSITFEGGKATTMNTGDVGTFANKVWTGSANSVTFNVTGTLNITKITVSFGDTPTPPVVELEEAANLADVKTKTAGAEYLINLSNAVVTYVNGLNAYIQDGTAGMLVYKSGHGLVAGQSISGKVKAELTLFNGLYELTSFDTAEATITDGAEIPTTTVTVAELLANPAKYESMRVKVENVTAESAFTSRKANVVSGENTLGLYQREPDAQFTFAAGDALDVTGYPGMFKEDVQLNVWEVEDVTVLGNEPPTPPVVEPEEAGSLKDAKNLPEGKYIITLENAVVTYVNGKNAYIEDGETGILVFLEEQTLEVGQVISGKVVADLANYYGLYELESFDTTNATITETEEIPLTTITVEELLADPAKYESRRVKVVNVTAESAFTNRKANIKEGEKTLGMYQKDEKAQFTFAAGDVLDVIGYPGMFREALQFNVWEVSDVTIHTVDGISTVTTGNAPAKAYTLDGRRVEKLTKGIYIVNGKKVLVK